MKKLILVLMAGVAVGCGGPVPLRDIAPEFTPYYDLFTKAAIDNGADLSDKDISIQFEDLSNLPEKDKRYITAGVCDTGASSVHIDPKIWRRSTEVYRILLIFHELGHCLLYLPHVADPQAIMYPLLDEPAKYYLLERVAQIAELFNSAAH